MASPIDPSVLVELLARSEVLGIKVATLDSVMTFQDIARLVKSHAPEKLLITGEDRFLGYSLMCGAQAALIGMAAACTELQAELLQTFRHGRCRAVPRLEHRDRRPGPAHVPGSHGRLHSTNALVPGP